MASKQGGGVGGFTWALLGFLAGVAATLAVQLLTTGGEHGEESEGEAPNSSAVVVVPKLPAPTLTHRHRHSSEQETAEAAAIAAQPDGPARAAPAADVLPPGPEAAAAPDVLADTPAPTPRPKKAKASPVETQVYDDAAAAGMTSRAGPAGNP